MFLLFIVIFVIGLGLMGIGLMKRSKTCNTNELLKRYPQQPLIQTGKISARPLPDAHTRHTIEALLLILNEPGAHVPYTDTRNGLTEEEWCNAHPRVPRPVAFNGLPRMPKRMKKHPRTLE